MWGEILNPTDKVICITIGLLFAWEAWTLMNERKADTISESVWRAVRKQPLIPFLLGLLMGHLLWIPERCWELF